MQSRVLACLLYFFSWQIGAAEYVIAVNESYQGNVDKGELQAIFDEMYRPLNIRPVVAFYPSKRGLRLANWGEIDAESARLPEVAKQYKNLIQVPEPIYQHELKFFCLVAEKCQLNSTNILGIVSGFQAAPAFCEQFNLQCLFNQDATFLRTALLNGGVDALVGSEGTLLHVLCDAPVKTVYFRNETSYPFVSYHLVNRKHEDKVAALSDSIKAMRERGVFATFFSRISKPPEDCKIKLIESS
ncbi:hypothetical protein [Alteromonas flava]|uniref:hypothetical protein n=1 Tax=Alteromonas flava TaxID=2048003 RepID=UPI000F5E5268|nr:hypothetical protein [Alteromonas flava]